MVIATQIAGPADALKRLATSRDADAWAWLLDEVGPEIHRVAHRLTGDTGTADDAVQECLLTLRDHAASFHPRTDPDRDALRWIMRVAANAALQVRRGRHRAAARDRDHASSAAPAISEPVGAGVERDETARLVRGELSRLREAERAAIVLHVVAGMSFDQVAAELHCPVGTAKVRVHRGLERLRHRLGRRVNDLSIAGVVSSLQVDDHAFGSLAGHQALLASQAHAVTHAIPITIGVLTMATKLSLAAATLLIIAAPVAMTLHSQEAPTVASAVPSASTAPRITDAEMLNRKLTFEFVNSPITEVASTLTAMGAPCSLERMGDVTLTLKVKDMRAKEAAGWIAKLCDASMKVAKGAIVLFPTPADQRVLLDQVIDLPLSKLTVSDALEVVGLATGVTIDRTGDPGAIAEVTLAAGSRKAVDILADIALQSKTPIRIDASGVQFGPLPVGPVSLAQAPAEAAVQLAQKVTLDLQDSDFIDALGFLQQITKVNIVVDPQVVARPLSAVTLRVSDTPVSQVLEALASTNALSVQWVDKAVFFTLAPPAVQAPTHTF